MPDAAAITPDEEASSGPVCGREWVALAVTVALGVWLRVAHSEHLAVEHFDEGVYAANWYCHPPGLPDGEFPRQYLYAPPLLPELCFWTLFASGSDPQSVMWINIVAGSLMIPLMWLVARQWFGVASGLIAAALCAFSDLHVALSRMVLTDVLLCLFLTAGVGAGVKAIVTGRLRWIAAAGILAALAWWTKYNGWLTLAITGAGAAGWLLFGRPRDIGPRVVLLRWGATAVIALLLWAPLWWSLQEVGGYGVVSTNHARYFVGLAGWWAARGAQLAKQSALDSGLGLGLSAVAITIPLFLWDVHVDTSAAAIGRRLQRAVQRGVTFAILAVALRGMLAAEVLLAVGLLLAESFTRSVDRDSPTVMHGSRALSWWTAVAWVTGLIVATPMYTPYPRLALPLACGSWLGVSILGRQPWEGRSISGRRTILQWIGISITLVLIPFLWLSRGPTTMLPAVAWEDQRGLEEMAGPIVTAAARDHGRHPTAGRQGVDAVLYVFAEPPLFYHLSALPNQPGFTYLVQPIGDHAVLERSDGSLANYVITGPHADAVATDAARFAKAEQAGRLRLVEELRYRPTTLVMLDQSDDVAASGSEQTVRLYRVQ